MSKQPKTFRSRSSDHVPVVPTMVSNSNAVGVKRIHVWRNADVFFQGIQVVVNTHRVPSIDVLLDVVSERIGLINGAKKLYTTSGTLIKDINKIKDGESYVASSSHFTPAAYGGQIQQVNKKKKKRSKTVHGKERKEKTERLELGDEISIPLNNPVEQERKKKKKKKLVKKKVEEEHHPRHLNLARHGSDETLAETAEVELPSELEDSEEEEEDDHHVHSHRERSPEHRRPSTKHSVAPSRSESRRESRKDVHEHEDKKEEEKKKDDKRRKSVTRRKSHSQHQQPNWGDLSSFTKNIDSLLRN